jgi:ATP-dependent DNA helicase UvrD/PcrA
MTDLTRAETDALLGFSCSDEQWACISAPPEPFVIVAGAGTGKTAVMAARVLWLVASGRVAAHQVLGLTFTNKAAAELAARVSRLLDVWHRSRRVADGARGIGAGPGTGPGPVTAVGADDTQGEPTISTYHSFARRLVDEEGLRVGIEPGARLLPASAVAQLAYRLVCRSDALAVTTHTPAKVAADVMTLDAHLAEQTLTTDEVRAHCRAVIADAVSADRPTKPVRDVGATAARRLELLDLVDELRAARSAIGGVDFSDHMRLCVDLVRRSPQLVEQLRAEFPVVLLDEYQDTSIAQRVILSTLFRGSAVTAVGDPLQAIYGWRSASVANIAAFGQHFGGATGEAPTRVLSVNRRSGAPILAAANMIATELRADHPQVAPLRAPDDRPAQVRAALLPTIGEERDWVVDQVEAMVAAGRPPQEIGILGRTNDSLLPLHAALVARGIPASVSGVAALESSPASLAVLSTMRLLADPADNRACVALLSGPRWRLGPADLAALAARAVELAEGPRPGTATGADLVAVLLEQTRRPDQVERPSLLEAAADPGPRMSPAAIARLAELRTELRWLHGRVGDPLPELVARIVTITGAAVEAALLARTSVGQGGPEGPGAGGDGTDAALEGLVALADDFSDIDGRTGLGAFLAHLDAAELLGSEEEVDLPLLPGCVQLMTMHKAKGLEFPVVALPHLSAGQFPGSKGMDRWTTQARVVPFELRDDRHVLPHLVELSSTALTGFDAACRAADRGGDDRLAYVAATRAQDVLLASGHWWGETQKAPRGPSPYLEALRAQADAVPVGGAEEWARPPEPDADGSAPTNPSLDGQAEVPWPTVGLRADDPTIRAAQAVEALLTAAADPAPTAWPALAGPPTPSGPPLPPVAPEVAGWVHREVAGWDDALALVLSGPAGYPDPGGSPGLPQVLSASAAMDLARDPTGFASRIARPMPVRRNRSAELGSAFHAWVESRLGVQPLITDDLLPGAADEGISSDEDLAALKEAFERLPHAAAIPAGLEVPFAVGLGERLIRGRIDAVFPALPGAPAEVRWDVVDWKTSAREKADPLQLAIYRLAWAELRGIPLETIRASFVYVRTGRIDSPDPLPDRDQLMALLDSAQAGAGIPASGSVPA